MQRPDDWDRPQGIVEIMGLEFLLMGPFFVPEHCDEDTGDTSPPVWAMKLAKPDFCLECDRPGLFTLATWPPEEDHEPVRKAKLEMAKMSIRALIRRHTEEGHNFDNPRVKYLVEEKESS